MKEGIQPKIAEVAEQDSLPRRADGTVLMGPQGWSNKLNKISGAAEAMDAPRVQQTTDLVINNDTQKNIETLPDSLEEKPEGGEERVVYMAPNRLPGGERRVQPW